MVFTKRFYDTVLYMFMLVRLWLKNGKGAKTFYCLNNGQIESSMEGSDLNKKIKKVKKNSYKQFKDLALRNWHLKV